jgi:hypothetical protein
MEAKVDIRKLQLLNDRINQTIDALNQVRLSVYGLQHSGGIAGQVPGMPQGTSVGIGTVGGYGVGAQPGIGLGQTPFGYGTPFVPGLLHTGLGVQSPWLSPFAAPTAWTQGYVNPLQQAIGAAYAQSPFQPVGWTGISHASPEIEALRMSHTFPYAFSNVNPFISF